MTRPLDPRTLRQAAARWPIETLNQSAAQSFLRSLAEDAERLHQQRQPGTLPDFSEQVKVLHEALAELQVVDDADQAWSLVDYLAQQGWDLVRR